MKKLFLLLLLAVHVRAYAQTAAPIPYIQFQYLDANGNPLSSGRLLTYAAGTSTPLATYTDAYQAGTNANPIILNAAGIPTSGGIYLGGACYKVIAQNSALVQQWSRDNVCDLGILARTSFVTKNDDKVRHCSQFTGANMGAKIAACIADLPSTGGTADARGFEGAQTITSNIFSGVTKKVTLLLGAGTTTITASLTVPSNIDVVFDQGSIWSTGATLTTTISGGFDATASQHFTGSGNLALTSTREVQPEWFGAIADDSTDNAAAFTAAKAAISVGAGLPGIIRLQTGIYKFTTGLTFGYPFQVIGVPGGGSTLKSALTSGVFLSFDWTGALLTSGSGGGLRDVKLKGFANANTAYGIQIGGSLGGWGFLCENCQIEDFGTGIGFASSARYVTFRGGVIRANDANLLIPKDLAAQTSRILFDHVTFSEQTGVVTPSVWVQEGDANFKDCIFLDAAVAIGYSTTDAAQVVISGSRMERTTGNYDLLTVNQHADNSVFLTNNYMIKAAGTPDRLAYLGNGKVSIHGLLIYVATMANALVLDNAVSVEFDGIDIFTGTVTTFIGGSTTGAVTRNPPVHGTVTLSGGAGTVTLTGAQIFSGTTTYQCTTGDQTGVAAVQALPTSASAFSVSGTGSHVISYICTGY